MRFYQIFLQILGKSEFNKYLVSGTFAFLADYSVLLIATELLGIHYLVSAVFGYAIGLLVSYMLNIRWVFRYRKYAHTSKKEFLIFVVIVIVGLPAGRAGGRFLSIRENSFSGCNIRF